MTDESKKTKIIIEAEFDATVPIEVVKEKLIDLGQKINEWFMLKYGVGVTATLYESEKNLTE